MSDDPLSQCAGENENLKHLLNQAISERDQARRDVCKLLGADDLFNTDREIAVMKGWDCFKEDGK